MQMIFQDLTALQFAERFALPLLLGLIALAGTVLGVLLGTWAEERERRRQAYSDAIRCLIAWHEYPYRIRRRPNDEPDMLQTLAEAGHRLQEDLRFHQTWVRTESVAVGEIYTQIAEHVRVSTGPWIRDAWQTAPAESPEAMNLNGWGPDPIDQHIAVLHQAVGNRFGWRRALLFNVWNRPDLPAGSSQRGAAHPAGR